MSKARHRQLILAFAGTALIGMALPAIGQEAPESLLPPGFSEPPRRAAPPAPAPAATPLPAQSSPANPDAAALSETPLQALRGNGPRRPLDRVGLLEPRNGGMGPTAWGRTDGRQLVTLMRRLDVPIASRWAQIQLRRALLSRTPTPPRVSAADWAAARIGLLLRLGEADAGRMMIEQVDPDSANAGLLRVARQTALATADPVALCPFTVRAAQLSKEPGWDFARAICAAFAGESSVSSMFLDRARARGGRGLDLRLTEKMIGATGVGRHTPAIDWESADGMSDWRFGLASALALEVPLPLYAGAPLHYQAWRARAPMFAPEARLDSARIAARLGVFSSSALVDLYGQAHEREGDVARDAPAALLRIAYRDEDQSARLAALRALWSEEGDQPGSAYVSHILTARAAARIVPDERFLPDTGNLVAAMFAAGLDVQAARWSAVVEAGSPSTGDAAWALLAVGSPRPRVDISARRIEGYGARLGPGRKLKVQMLIAALGGLGRLSDRDFARLAKRYELRTGPGNGYTRTLAAAGRKGEKATVALLAATGMQTSDWRTVPPAHLYHIVAALRRAGSEPAARMIAAEALSRL